MQVELIMFRNGGERRSFAVVRNLTTIGRREDCDLRIPVGDVSRKHCRLVLSADNLRVQDLGSSNGTWVNGQQVQDAFLNAGDTVTVGPVNFIVQIDGVPAENDLDTPIATSHNDSEVGATGLALAALEANKGLAESSDVGETGDVAEVGDLLEPMPETAAVIADDTPDELFSEDGPAEDDVARTPPAGPAVGEPVVDLSLDELPAGEPDPFDLVELDDGDADASALTPLVEAPAEPATPEPPPAVAAAAAADDWDFLIEEPPAEGESDLRVDFDQPHGH